MKIGVFDSGIGGKAVAHWLARDFSDAEIIYIHDREHMPYGGRDKKDIIRLTETALQPILNNTCKCIVIACNTATTAAIEYLRASYPNEKFVGDITVIEPDCSTWAEMIESDRLDEQHIKDTIQSILAAKADVIVLACTHYHWIVASLLSR